MIYDSLPVLCRKCLDKEIPEKELLEYLDDYVRSLPAEKRVDEPVYNLRLSKCAECGHRLGYTCTLCGCYVQTRAAKKNMRCPIPGYPKWTENAHDEGD
ncbi:MAG: hypothetical protein IJC48_00440 [Clostridia bacterium]|nr:hypothetical protein [Clostridia bacterium]